MNNRVRNLSLICLAMALVVVGTMQARRAFKNARSRSLVAEATLHFKAKDYFKTSNCLEAALKANPSNVEAVRLTADLLERVGSPAAIAWRVRASQLYPLSMDYRLDWAQTAVKLRYLKSVEDALSGLDEEARTTARYHKLAGALAWGQGKPTEAEQHYEQARRLEPTNPSNLVNLSTIGLTSTNGELAESARLTLQTLAETNSPYALEALRRLKQEAIRRKDFPDALAYARRVATNSDASFVDKVDCLSLLTVTHSADAGSWLEGLKQQATNSPVDTVILAKSLLHTLGPTNTLKWLRSLHRSFQGNPPVPMIITDCQIGVKDWPGLLATVEKQDWGESETLRLALESLARRSLGDAQASNDLWQRASRQSARRLDRLYELTQLAGAWGWKNEKSELLNQVLSEFPHETWAASSLIMQLHQEGNTKELERLFTKLSAADPRNAGIKSSFARICLLRNDQLPAAHLMAREAYDKKPHDPVVVSTYAYSLLLEGRQQDALDLVVGLNQEALRIPWVATCYGLIEARSGNAKAAREPLARAEAANLLPEEQALIRLAKSGIN